MALLLLCSWAAASDDAAFGDFEFDSPDEAVLRCQEWRIGVLDYDRGAQVLVAASGTPRGACMWLLTASAVSLPAQVYANSFQDAYMQAAESGARLCTAGRSEGAVQEVATDGEAYHRAA